MVTRITIPVGCRSDEGLSDPIIKRLEKNPKFIVNIWDYGDTAGDAINSAIYTDNQINLCKSKPNLALITGDRQEMLGAALSFFHNDIPIAHLYAGITGDEAVYDKHNRHAITLWSHIQFCESEKAARHVKALKESIGLTDNAYVVGCTHMDDFVLNNHFKAYYINRPYCLVLYNPLTRSPDLSPLIQMQADLSSIHDLISDSNVYVTYWIGPNPDGFGNVIKRYIDSSMGDLNIVYQENAKRSHFLHLLKHCDKFISNSSCQFYEAPYFLKPEQIINIGPRNADRETITEYGASDKIVEVLGELYA